jgi:hypothetical protein
VDCFVGNDLGQAASHHAAQPLLLQAWRTDWVRRWATTCRNSVATSGGLKGGGACVLCMHVLHLYLDAVVDGVAWLALPAVAHGSARGPCDRHRFRGAPNTPPAAPAWSLTATLAAHWLAVKMASSTCQHYWLLAGGCLPPGTSFCSAQAGLRTGLRFSGNPILFERWVKG